MDSKLVAELSSRDPTDDDPLFNILKAAIHEEQPKYSLHDIATVLTSLSVLPPLNGLELIPLLLPISDSNPSALRILEIVGNEASAKENILAVQECLESWRKSLDQDEEQDEEQVIVDHLIIIIDLYTSSLKRLTIRKSSPLETIKPIIKDLHLAIESVAAMFSRLQGRRVITSVSQLIQACARFGPLDTEGVQHELKELLTTFLHSTICHCAVHIDSALAQRCLESYQPERILQSGLTNDWLGGHGAMIVALEASKSLSHHPSTLLILLQSKDYLTSLGAFILLAHSGLAISLDSTIPHFISAMVNNIALDEALCLLLISLKARSSGQPNTLDQTIISPLQEILVPLSITNPSPAFRNVSFALLTTLLAQSPPAVRVQILIDLISPECQFEQMRVAAVGLAKDVLLQSLSPESGISPRDFLVRLNPLIFRIEKLPLSPNEFRESHEPARLHQCLGLYRVILARDMDNQTGIRDAEHRKKVDTEFLRPLREVIQYWQSEFHKPGVGETIIMSILTLSNEGTEEDPQILIAIGGLQLMMQGVVEVVGTL